MIDILPGGNVYPWLDAGGGTSLGGRMSGMSAFPGSPAKEDAAGAPGPEQIAMLGGAPSLLIAGVTLVVLLIALRFIGHAVGEESEFKSIKVTTYNAFVIGLAAAIMLPVFKFLAAKQPIGALKNWVMAA
jgi:hypothetical protein